MTCANCANIIGTRVKKISGVNKAKVSLTLNNMNVEFEDNVSNEEIIEAVGEAGYKAELIDEISFDNKIDKELKILLVKFSLSLLLTLPMWIGMILMLAKVHSDFSLFLHNPIFQIVITFIIEFVIGWKFFYDVYHGLKNKRTNMSFLVVVGTLAAIILSIYNATINGWITNMDSNHLYFEAAASIITFVLLGKVFETIAKNKTTNSLRSLTNLLPNDAIKIVGGNEVVVKLNEIKIGDILLVKSGSSIPLDGIVIKGESYVNESMLTGESKSVKKTIGSSITGATINEDGSFEMKVLQVGKNTTLSKILNLVKDAQSDEIEIQKTVDKISTWFIPLIFGLALITFIAWTIYYGQVNENVFVNTIAVIVIACPCALGLATPTAIMVGTGKAAQAGILFKGGNKLEKLAKLNTIVFDKTGTLTKGKMEVQNFIMVDKEFEQDRAIQMIKLLELKSNHPIAKAIKNYEPNISTFASDNLKDFKTIISFGIEGVIDGKTIKVGKPKWFTNELDQNSKEQISLFESNGETTFVMQINNKIVSIISVADSIKENAVELIKQLNDLNIETVLLTGDSKLTAEYVANQLNIKKVYSEVSIENKSLVIEQLQKENKIVAMIGDGINDSVALTKADIGMAMSSGVDVAIESSDVVLMKDDLLEVINAIKAAKKTLRKIKTNLFWAFVYNVIAIPAAMFGILLPEIAALAMAMSSVSVVINSLFLRIK